MLSSSAIQSKARYCGEDGVSKSSIETLYLTNKLDKVVRRERLGDSLGLALGDPDCEDEGPVDG